MDRYKIYSKEGRVIAEVTQLEYSGELMSVPNVTVSLKSPVPFNLKAGAYLDFRGERFTLGAKPNVRKTARRYTYGEAFVYENVVFQSAADELTRCRFLDVVPEELIDLNGDPIVDEHGDTIINSQHYTSLPNFSFYAESVKQLQERLQANLDRVYTGAERWRVVVAEGTISRPYNFSFSNETCWAALCKVNEIWELSFVIRGRTITIGGVGSVVGHIFRYGKGNGLVEVTEENNEDALVVTRLRAYGSTRNMPYRYYNKLWKNTITGEIKYFPQDPNYSSDRRGGKIVYRFGAWERLLSASMYMPNLMLPLFTRGRAQDANGNPVYIDGNDTSEVRNIYLGGTPGEDAWLQSSEMVDEYGVNEDTVFFNKEDETGKNEDNIYPSIEGMTAAQLAAAGIPCDLDDGDNGNLDEVVTADLIADDGVLPNNTEDAAPEDDFELDAEFSITIKDIGFDINDYIIAGEQPQISMKSGECVGRTFEVLEVTKSGNKYVLRCERTIDDSLQLAFPYKDYNVKAGDKFVLLHIRMPEVYVFAAEQRLYERAKRYLLENDHNKGVYSPTIDNIFLKRNPEIAATIKEGDIFLFEDEDLNLNKSVTISSLTIKVGEKMVEEYEVTLSEDTDADFVSRVTDSVSKNIFTSNVSITAIEDIVNLTADQKYLSKKFDDTAQGVISFPKGINVADNYRFDSAGLVVDEAGSPRFVSSLTTGSGWRAWMQDGLSQLEVDNLTIRRVMNVAELLIHKIRATGGEVLVSAADGKITSVDGNVITLEDVDGNRTTMFRVGDYVRCQRWDAWLDRTFGYWLKVTAASGMNLTLDIENRRDGMTDTPQIGDEIVLLGSTSPARQGAVRISATEGGVPVVDVLSGIDKPTTAGCLKARLGGLDGIVDEAFGQNQPQGYGLYANNAYLKGVLVLANGEEVGSKFSVLEDRVQSIVTGMSEDNNLLSNPTFDTMEDWSIKRDVETKPTVHALLNSSSVSQLFLGDSILMTDEGYDGSIITQKDGRRCLYLKAWDELSHTAISTDIRDMEFVRVVMEVWSLPEVDTTIYVRNGLLAPALEEWSAIATGGWRTISIDLDRQTLTKYLTAFTFYANDDIYISNIWLGVPTESKIEQTADRIELSVKSGLNEAGISIEDKKITLEAENTEVKGDFEVTRLRTKPAEGQQARVEIADNLIKVFGAAGIANIVLGIENGYAVLKYYDNNGNFLYNLGPNGLGQLSVREERLTEITYLNESKSADVTLWVYTAKMTQGRIAAGDVVRDQTKAAEADGLVFTSETIYASGDLVNKADGTYWRKDEIVITSLNKEGGALPSDFPQTPSGGGTWVLDVDESAPIDETLVYPLHQQTKVDITNGVSTETIWYWQNIN